MASVATHHLSHCATDSSLAVFSLCRGCGIRSGHYHSVYQFRNPCKNFNGLGDIPPQFLQFFDWNLFP
jgi:hypothetical protein